MQKISAKELHELIETYLKRQVGPADCCALGAAYECATKSDLAGVLQADSALFSLKLVEEMRNASARSGASLVRCVAAFSNNKVLAKYERLVAEKKANGMYPVALAVACTTLEIQKKEAGMIFLYSFCVGMAGAALRLGVVEHVSAQKMLHELRPAIAKAVEDNIDRPLDQMWQFAPGIDVIQLEHERLDSKMFIT